MTDEEINVAIAEACGWTEIEACGNRRPWGYPPIPHTPPQRIFVPDYCNDLNAMHEAEKVLDAAQRYAHLRNLSQDWRSWNDGTAYVAICYATARQRAEAFLRTIGKWKEAE